MTEVNYNSKDHSYECAVRIFTDDLESDIAIQIGKDFSFDKLSLEKKKFFLEEYLSQNLLLYNDKTKLRLKVIGSETEDLATWIYASAPSQNSLAKIKNTILFSMYDDQTNILHLKKDKNKSVYFFKVDNAEIDLP